MPIEQGVVGVFACADDLVKGMEAVMRGGFHVLHFFSPTRIREVEEARPGRASLVRLWTLFGGILGGLSFLGLAVYAHASFRLITGAKPVFPFVPCVVVCFEGVILLAVIFSVVAWVLTAGLPRTAQPAGYDPSFSGEEYGLVVSCPPADCEALTALLTGAGAREVRHVSG